MQDEGRVPVECHTEVHPAMCACDVIRSLLAESSEKEKSILDLQGRLMDLSAATTISSAPATPADPTQSATEPAPTFSAPATPEHPARAASASDITPLAPATSEDPALAASGIARLPGPPPTAVS